MIDVSLHQRMKEIHLFHDMIVNSLTAGLPAFVIRKLVQVRLVSFHMDDGSALMEQARSRELKGI